MSVQSATVALPTQKGNIMTVETIAQDAAPVVGQIIHTRKSNIVGEVLSVRKFVTKAGKVTYRTLVRTEDGQKVWTTF